jgi:hypothetical protein
MTDYTRLKKLLIKKDWKNAAQETVAKMLEVSGRQAEGSLSAWDIEDFPDADLKEIDKLWADNSNNQFGFTAQKEIWENLEQAGHCEEFGKQVGWYRHNSWLSYKPITASFSVKDEQDNDVVTEIYLPIFYESATFSTSAKKGHLPILPLVGWWCWTGGMAALVKKLEKSPISKP